MSDEARRAVVTDEDREHVEACYAAPDCVLPAPDGVRERRVGHGWALVVLADGTVERAVRLH